MSDPLAALEAEESGQTGEPEAQSEGEGAQQPEWAQRFQSPDQMYESYRHAERKIGEQGNELGQMRQRLEQLETVMQAAPEQPQQQNGYSDQDARAYWENRFAEDPVGAQAEFTQALVDQQVEERLQQIREEFNPYMQTVNRDVAGRSVEMLQREFGAEVVQRNANELAAFMQENGELFLLEPDKRQQIMRTFLAGTEALRQRGGQGATTPPAQPVPHMEGGSAPHPPQTRDERDPILAEMDEVKPPRDAFGTVHYH